MSEKLEQHFKNFANYGNLWNLDDYDELYKFCVESVLENTFLEKEEFISYFEKYCNQEYKEQWNKNERVSKWYEKYHLLFNALTYISKHYNITPNN